MTHLSEARVLAGGGGVGRSPSVSFMRACVPCRCSEICSCVRPIVERFLNTGKHELSILRNPLELFTFQQHATDTESALITPPATLWWDILGNKETTNSNSPETHHLLFFSQKESSFLTPMYVTDLSQQAHFYVDASSLNKFRAFFYAFMCSCSTLSVFFFPPNFGCWHRVHKLKLPQLRHQSNILRSAVNAHMTPCCLTKSNGLSSAAVDAIGLLKQVIC